MTKAQLFEQLCIGNYSHEKTLFRPILMHFSAKFSGNSYGKFASDYNILVESNLKALEYFDLDMVGLISDPYRETSAFGAKISFPEEAVPICENIIVKNLDDVKSLKSPNVYKEERTLDRIKGAELFHKRLKGIVPIIGWVEGPLAEACDIAGISQMLIHLMLNPDFCDFILDKCVVTAKDFAKAQIEAGCTVIGIGDAICSQIDAFTYDTFIKERHREIINFIHECGGKVKLHICGDITHHLPSISELNVDILDLDYKVDLNNAFEILGPDVIRCGNINPILVEKRSSEEIYNATRLLIEGEKNRKFILSAGCEITVNTKHENLMAMRMASVK